MIKDKFDYQQTINKLNNATKSYDEGSPIMTDQEWDKMYWDIVEFEKNSNIIFTDSPTQKIHYEVLNALTKVEHNHPMLSLDKTKDWDEFVGYFDLKDVTGMVKLDGLTCSLRYENGKLVSAETRGNGFIGENILHNAKVIPSIPKYLPEYTSELIVDGEIICIDEDFKPFSEIYANPRNFVSGSIRLLDSKECASRNLTFIVWNVIKGFDEIDSFCDKLSAIEYLGFKVVPWTSSFDLDAKEFLINQAKELGYPIDGLVGRFDSVSYGNSLGETGHHSRAAYAFKFYDEEYETELLNIEWSLGRTGQITPIAVFSPVDDGISIIERASLHNLSVMKEQLYIPYKGEKIWIYKANQIIPQISKHLWVANDCGPMIMFYIPKECPVCGFPTTIETSDTGVEFLKCNNSQCEGKLLTRLTHICSKNALDIKGLSKATLEKLIDWEWIAAPKDIYSLKLHRNEWIKKQGFGEKSVDNILSSINKSKETELWRVLSAGGIPEIGIIASKQLADYFKTYDNFKSAIHSFNFLLLPNFGSVMADYVKTFDYSELDELASYLVIKEEVKNQTLNCKNLIFVITGALVRGNRDNLKNIITAAGGKVTDSISTKTSYLITNETKETAKYKKAKQLNIPIITEQEFYKKFDI